MAVIDVCTFNGEHELWDIHYNVLKDHVDEFIVIAFDTTFSGKERPITFPDAQNYPKARFILHTKEVWGKYLKLASTSPNTAGAEHWKTEFAQKESIKDALTHLKDDDIVFIGDVDEVWKPELKGFWGKPAKLKLHVYTYYLNNLSTEGFWGTIVAKYEDIQDQCLNHLRTNTHKTDGYGGWHFTSIGGPDALHVKLTDSYTEESYATPHVLQNLSTNYGKKDFLGRNFTYTVDESEWPQFLRENRAKYEHLCIKTK